MTLTDFLSARIAEDEQAAQHAADENLEATWELDKVHEATRLPRPMASHIARWDPARVLAECEAKRRIIEHHLAWEQTLHRQGSEDYTEGEETMYRMAMQWVIRRLLQPYANHPDYDESWRPE